jgi:hypothetical protein
MTRREVQEAMGIMTTDAEAAAMLELLTARGITELDQVSDEEFRRANSGGDFTHSDINQG